ncbi:MAG TPA: 4Fe-4S binding protein [Firmicutes bacterium]|nr:4Fe-4S binding protein [Bacillota bacterium]
MIRKIIKIDEEKCNGCGLCAQACHEGAIGMISGKARLLRDDYCDGLGDCLPVCPTGAISFEVRQAAPYDEEAVKKRIQEREREMPVLGCVGVQAGTIQREEPCELPQTVQIREQSMLSQWPVQIKLAPVSAPFFADAKLLIAADCTAYAYGGFHDKFIKGRITLIGCPKLDEGDYSEKLASIIKNNSIKDVALVRMEVPCCGGMESAVKTALQKSGKFIPWQVVTISTSGEILDSGI